MPDVSVILTVYNGLPYLREAVQSILDQTYRDFEFVIVDNASTDGTAAFIEGLRDPRIRFTRLPSNQGQTRALNRAVRDASGRWMARMDADDVSIPERLLLQQAHLAAHPEAAVVGSWIEEIDAHGRRLKIMRYPTDPLAIRCHLLSDGDLTRRCVAHPSTMLLREAVLKVGGYNEDIRIAQDYDLWTRLAPRYEIHNIGRVLLRYRVFPESTSKRSLPEMARELDGIVDRNIARLSPDLSPDERQHLIRMLRNQSPEPGETLPSLYALFDHLFESASRNWGVFPRLAVLRDRIKTYYVPRLFRRDPARVFGWVAGMTVRQPGLWIDSKWYKNVAKRFGMAPCRCRS